MVTISFSSCKHMHLCFVDESGTPLKPDGNGPRYFVFGGIIIPEERWHGIRQKIIGLKAKRHYHGEIKWRFFSPKNNDTDNPMREWSQEDKNEFRNEIFKIIIHTKSVRIICGVTDAINAYAMGHAANQDDIYFHTYKIITERFQYFLQDVTKYSGHDSYGIIIADHRNSREDNRFRQQHERLVRESSKYSSRYDNFIESIFLSPSHLSIGLQLADMVAGAVFRFFEYNDGRWINLIRPSFRTGQNGRIDGWGIARFPKRGWTGPILT